MIFSEDPVSYLNSLIHAGIYRVVGRPFTHFLKKGQVGTLKFASPSGLALDEIEVS